MRSGIVAVIGIFFVASLVFAPVSGATEYVNDEEGFSLHVPDGWEKREMSGHGGIVAAFYGPDGALLMVRVVSGELDLEDPGKRDKVLDQFLDSVGESGMTGIEILDEGWAPLKEEKGYAIHYHYYLPSGVRVENASTFIPGEDRYFIMTFSALPPVYHRIIEDVADNMVLFRVVRKRDLPWGGKHV